jgi:hypothetical protein
MRFPHPFEGVRPPTDYWVDRPEVYSSNAQPTGTNRPNTCHTNPQHNQQTTSLLHRDGRSTRNTTNNTRPQSNPNTPGYKSYGGHSGRETPGPIPNPEVKPASADGTATERLWESRTPPDILSPMGYQFADSPLCVFRHFAGVVRPLSVHRVPPAPGSSTGTCPQEAGSSVALRLLAGEGGAG